MRTDKQQAAFDKGYEATQAELRVMRFSTVRDKFNAENPGSATSMSDEAYHYAQGQMSALLEWMQ